jgi:hypothetical protein
MVVWIAAGVGVFALAVVLTFARVLGAIGREVADLQETMMWADWPTSARRRADASPASEYASASSA